MRLLNTDYLRRESSGLPTPRFIIPHFRGFAAAVAVLWVAADKLKHLHPVFVIAVTWAIVLFAMIAAMPIQAVTRTRFLANHIATQLAAGPAARPGRLLGRRAAVCGQAHYPAAAHTEGELLLHGKLFRRVAGGSLMLWGHRRLLLAVVVMLLLGLLKGVRLATTTANLARASTASALMPLLVSLMGSCLLPSCVATWARCA